MRTPALCTPCASRTAAKYRVGDSVRSQYSRLMPFTRGRMRTSRGAVSRAIGSAQLLCAAIALVIATLAAATPARAAANAQDALIYMPYGLVHFVRPASQVDGYLAEVDSYDLGQVVFAMPKFKKLGVLKVPKHNREMLLRWSERAAAYDAQHGAHMSLTAVFPGKVATKKGGLNLDDPATRANIVAGVESTLGLGLAGVQLDLEPYPTSPGFISLLEELDAMYARVGFHGRFSIAAPASTSKWSPSYLHRVSELVTQLDPLFYDSEYTTIAGYQAWVSAGLAYYSANAVSTCRLVPILPSYSANPWHDPAVENIETATGSVSQALSAGARVNGAGIWWGYGFLLEEEGAYDPGADRAAWLSTTLNLPFSP